MQTSSRPLALIVVATLCLAMAGCRSSKTVIKPQQVHTSAPSKPDKKPAAPAASPQRSAVVEEAEAWLGVPYRYGGNDREGVDCSGLVVQVYLNAVDMALPRTSAQQRDFSIDVARSKMTPGDLVFFDTSRKPSGKVTHVGIFIGDDTMIHSSTSRGVIKTSLSEPYYSERFLGAGRLLKTKEAAPESKPAVTQQPKPAPQAIQQPTPQPTPQPAPAATTPSGSDPRSRVLDNLIEHKLDSIYNGNPRPQ